LSHTCHAKATEPKEQLRCNYSCNGNYKCATLEIVGKADRYTEGKIERHKEKVRERVRDRERERETQSLNHISVHQLVAPAIRTSQQPASPIGFFSL